VATDHNKSYNDKNKKSSKKPKVCDKMIKLDKIIIPESAIYGHIGAIKRHRIRLICCKAIRANMLDAWDAWDGKELTSGDQIFQPADEHEAALWNGIREECKKAFITIRLRQIGGRKGGRPKKTVDK
jgi:hypothetical protein